MTQHVVYDCNVYFQALIGPTGPAGACLEAVASKQVRLFLSQQVLDELLDVCTRPAIATKFRLTDGLLKQYLSTLRNVGEMVDEVPHVFTYDRDPKDEHYIDLAIATNSELVVSRDRDLLALADPNDPAGRDFMARYPSIHILTPVEMVARLGQC